MKRLKALRRLTIQETDLDRPLEASWKQLMRDLRSMPHLQRMELGGSELTDDALGPLAGHPGLESVTLLGGKLTLQGARMFKTMPRLKSLHIEGMTYEGDAWMTPEEIKTLQEEMPGVNVDIL